MNCTQGPKKWYRGQAQIKDRGRAFASVHVKYVAGPFRIEYPLQAEAEPEAAHSTSLLELPPEKLLCN